jgi:acetylornithine deacetylase/succinyl-diaminopimelate desuccinylase-like protein
VTTAQTGYLRLRIAVPGLVAYTPFTKRGKAPADTLNPYARAAHVIQAIEEWAVLYEQAHTVQFEGGVITPRAQIQEMRGSGPIFTTTVDHCYIFLDVRLVPGASPASIIGEIRSALKPLDLDCKIAVYDYRRGFFAEGAERLLQALRQAHQSVLGRTLEYARGEPNNWRDTNAFNEAGIPSVSYGPPSADHGKTGGAGEARPVAVSDLISAAKVFAYTALSICDVDANA